MCDAGIAKGKTAALIGQTHNLEHLKKFANKVDVYQASDIKSIEGDGSKVTGLVKQDGSKVNYDFIFVENGYESNLNFLPSDIELDEKKQLIVDGTMSSPYFEGVFGCGDCINNETKMIQPAMQQAAIAADSAVKYIKSKN
ncbi:MAG: FAD-dependent oxidoreductase [Mycoplasmoidaceae bacterium]|nr:FAD-dependent oxidoreductase [Mycoplasmoidaceae bacterium]